MKILVVADEESRSLWDFFSPDKLEDVDLIISCGDLNPNYLQFLVTFGNCPLLYIHGNHDSVYQKDPPDGCICIEDRIYDFKGLRILGLGGSMRYKKGPFMYTERRMQMRVWKALPKILARGGIDILVTHSPVRGYGDMEDLPHRGFACFSMLLDRFRPAYMLHGHVHKAYGHFERTREYPSGTILINGCESCFVEIPDEQCPEQGRTGWIPYRHFVRVQRRRAAKGKAPEHEKITLA
jgi:predicted phosphodiesterase